MERATEEVHGTLVLDLQAPAPRGCADQMRRVDARLDTFDTSTRNRPLPRGQAPILALVRALHSRYRASGEGIPRRTRFRSRRPDVQATSHPAPSIPNTPPTAGCPGSCRLADRRHRLSRLR